MLGIHDLDIRSVNDITSSKCAGSALCNTDAYDIGLVVKLCADTLNVKDDLGHIFDDSRNCGELMLNLVDFNRCNCRTGK